MEKQMHIPRTPQPSGSFCSAACLMAPFDFYWLVSALPVALTFSSFLWKKKKRRHWNFLAVSWC